MEVLLKSIRCLSEKLSKYRLFLRLTVFVTFALFSSVNAEVYSQQARLSINIREKSLSEVLMAIQKQSDYNVLFSVNDVGKYKNISVSENNVEIPKLMNRILSETSLEYEIVEKNIIVRQKSQQKTPQQPKKTIRGTISDSEGLPLPGVHVIVETTDTKQKMMAVSSPAGHYSLVVNSTADFEIKFSSIGMKPQTIKIAAESAEMQVHNVTMEVAVSEVEEVVVTGFFERKKDTYTGVTQTVKGTDLIKMGTKNVMESLNQIDPSFRIEESNTFGSDPNKLPEITFRGASSFENVLDDSDLNLLKTDPNLPTFVLDGFVVSLEDVVDLDMNRIESVTILKDAVSAVTYGSYAANGVFVIKTKDPEVGKMRVSYSGNYKVNVPDLGSYDMLNGPELLQYQENLGLYSYDYENRHQFGNYMQIKRWIYEGVDTDWKSQPVQNSFAQQHSLSLSGGDESVRYGLGVSYNDDKGVMKGSFRQNLSINMHLNYHISDKLDFTNRLTFYSNNANDSQYGSFSDYLSMPNYFPLYNEQGNLNELFGSGSWGNLTRINPLAEAEAGNFGGSEYTNVVNNLALNWTIRKGLKLTSRLGYSINKSRREDFLSPKSITYYNTQVPDDEKGEYTIDNTKSENISFNVMLNYTYRKEGHVVTSTIGGTMAESKAVNEGMVLQGFSNDRYFPSFAKGYEIGGIPRGSEATMRNAGFLGSVNYAYRNVILVDGAFRIDGSSAFGTEEKFAPFFSVGSGFNLTSTQFVKDISWLNTLRVTFSYGETGSISFAPYQARDMFTFFTNYRYRGNIGVQLKALGNESLVWQTTKSKELNLQTSVFDGLLDISGSIYDRRTVDMISPITLPTSSGFNQMTTNLGEMSNKGVEFNFRSILYNNKNSNLVFTFTGGHNKNRIESLNGGLKSYNQGINDIANENEGQEYNYSSRFQEGSSVDDLYAVRSLGIDPQTGEELYLDKDGNPTWEWSAEDMVVVGNRAPKIEGSVGFNYSYKRFSASMSGMYRYGGVAYNATLLNKVENSDKWMNVDRRALEQTWQKPGDVVPFKANADGSTTRASSRFIQDNNQFYISAMNFQYRLSSKLSEKMLMTSTSIGVSLNDIWYTSSIKRERGTGYPYARSFSLRINANF